MIFKIFEGGREASKYYKLLFSASENKSMTSLKEEKRKYVLMVILYREI